MCGLHSDHDDRLDLGAAHCPLSLRKVQLLEVTQMCSCPGSENPRHSLAVPIAWFVLAGLHNPNIKAHGLVVWVQFK